MESTLQVLKIEKSGVWKIGTTIYYSKVDEEYMLGPSGNLKRLKPSKMKPQTTSDDKLYFSDDNYSLVSDCGPLGSPPVDVRWDSDLVDLDQEVI